MLMTGLISGFTLATQRVEAQAIHTDTTGIDAGETQDPDHRRQLAGLLRQARRKGPFPVILVNEEIFGVHEYIKDICRRLAKAWISCGRDGILCAHRRSFENDRLGADLDRRDL